MSNTVRLGIIGLTHDHIWDHLPDVLASDRIDLVLAAPRAHHVLEFVARITLSQIAQILEQTFAVTVKADKHEAAPGLEPDRLEAERGLVKADRLFHADRSQE